MGNKIRPDSLRLGIVGQWKARWFNKGTFKEYLEEDLLLRRIIKEKISTAGIVSIAIERHADDLKINIKAARPGLVIGRGGKGVEDLNKSLVYSLKKLYIKRGQANAKLPAINLNIEELKRSEVSAANVAQNIAWDLEKRMPFRRLMKRYLDLGMQNREVKGMKVALKGRLNGAEIARAEWLAKGKLPLQTLRANIDYAEATAFTSYGTIGVKVWVYKGEVFDDYAAT